MTVLVTGATGFLGSHIVEELLRQGHSVRALFQKASDTSFLRKLQNVEIVEGAVEDQESLFRAMEGVEVVVHAAGLVKARRPGDFHTVNAIGTGNAFRAALRHRPRMRRFVHVSSLAAAGPCDAQGRPVPADAEPRPVTHYGRSKLESERVLLADKDELEVVILRPCAIYGPRDREVLAFFKSIALGVLPLTNPLGSKLSMIFAPDCARACARAIDAAVSSGTVLSLDDGAVHTFAELIEQIEGAVGKRAWLRLPLSQRTVRGIARLTEIYGRITNRAVMLTPDKCNELFEQWVADGTAARAALAWAPEVPFSQGVRLTADWYRNAGWL